VRRKSEVKEGGFIDNQQMTAVCRHRCWRRRRRRRRRRKVYSKLTQ